MPLPFYPRIRKGERRSSLPLFVQQLRFRNYDNVS